MRESASDPWSSADLADISALATSRSDGAVAPPERMRGDAAGVAETLGLAGAPRSRRRKLKRVLPWAAPLLVIIGVALAFWMRRAPDSPVYQLSTARHGDLKVTVTATGALAPQDTVYVGTEVSGVIDVVAADYNDRVTKGQVLAVVNTDQLRAQIQQSRASLAVARAAVQQAEATLAEVAPQTARAESLYKRTMIAAQDIESARAVHARAGAARASAIAQLEGAQAALDVQQTALRKATIRAPISGIVLERSVERGRTVTAAFQTPVLFVLAADLARMTLSLDVDEADIGQVASGQTAEFSVDAYPERVFTASVRSVRNAAKTVNGVVTYQAILDVANPELLLRPGMTATAHIATARVSDALLVPNAALRYSPRSPGLPSGGQTPVTRAGERQVWVIEGTRPKAIAIHVGGSDGERTEVLGGELKSADKVIVGDIGE
jgi:HlyD family secretion protein